MIDEANRKFLMEFVDFHTKTLNLRFNSIFFSFAGRKASTSTSWALRPRMCGLTFLFAFQAVRPEMHTEIQAVRPGFQKKHLTTFGCEMRILFF